MKRYNILAVILISFGALSLAFGWPWGALVGAILILAGVIALRSKPQRPPAPKAPKIRRAVSNDPFTEATTLQKQISDLETQGEPVPTEYLNRLSLLVKEGLEKNFSDYDEVLRKKGDETVELSEFARNLRGQYNWPATGSVLGLPMPTK